MLSLPVKQIAVPLKQLSQRKVSTEAPQLTMPLILHSASVNLLGLVCQPVGNIAPGNWITAPPRTCLQDDQPLQQQNSLQMHKKLCERRNQTVTMLCNGRSHFSVAAQQTNRLRLNQEFNWSAVWRTICCVASFYRVPSPKSRRLKRWPIYFNDDRMKRSSAHR